MNALQGMAAIGQRPLLMEVSVLKLMGLNVCVIYQHVVNDSQSCD